MGPIQTHCDTLFPLQYIASRHSRWKVWLHLVRQPTAMGPRALLSVMSLYPEATVSFSIQMMQSYRQGTQHSTHLPLCTHYLGHSAPVQERKSWLCQKKVMLGHCSSPATVLEHGSTEPCLTNVLEGLAKNHRPGVKSTTQSFSQETRPRREMESLGQGHLVPSQSWPEHSQAVRPTPQA